MDEIFDCADELIFRIGFAPQAVEGMTRDDIVHYLDRFLAWGKRQKR